MSDRVIEIAPAQRLGAARQLMIGLGGAGSKPDRPERVLGHLVHHRIGIFELLGYSFNGAPLADQ